MKNLATCFGVLYISLASAVVAAPARPVLNLPDYQLPRKPEVVRQVYDFAADHPEVLKYVPCFCGCEASGHKAATDCFVKSRTQNGDVQLWNEHGMGCAMCLAVAERAMNMHSQHASVKDIRASVERDFSHVTSSRTDTPIPHD